MSEASGSVSCSLELSIVAGAASSTTSPAFTFRTGGLFGSGPATWLDRLAFATPPPLAAAVLSSVTSVPIATSSTNQPLPDTLESVAMRKRIFASWPAWGARSTVVSI